MKNTAYDVKNYAIKELNSYDGCKHAVYGVCYHTEDKELVEKIAPTPDDIRYFYSDESYQNFINYLYRLFYDYDGLIIYSVHKDEKYVD